MSEFVYSTKRASFDRETRRKSTKSGGSPALTNVDVVGLQRIVGNRAVQTLLHPRQIPHRASASVQDRIIQRAPVVGGGTVAAAPAPSPAPMDYATMSAEQLRAQHKLLQVMLMTMTFSPLNAAAPTVRREIAKVEQALVDKVVAEQIRSMLSDFQLIEVFIPGTSKPLTPGQTGPPAPLTITFHAAYFINTPTSKAHVKGARGTAFAGLRKAADASGAASLVESGGKPYSSGRAAEVGKATPENVRQIVQEALDAGAIEQYAIQKGKLAKTKKLSTLSSSDAATVVQDWVIDNGVGVDCSGFVLQAAVHGREAVHAELAGLGVPEAALPKEIGHGERKASSFANGTKVAKPTDLRAGDAWVLHKGAHVKIVIDVRRATNAKGKPIIEFDTAESAGDSTHTKTGPTLKLNKTTSLTKFGVQGSFHRI